MYYSLCGHGQANRLRHNNIRLLGQAVKTPPFHGGNRGSIPLGVTIYFGRIAQLGEHLPYKQGVIGSSPIVPTIKKFNKFKPYFMLAWLNGRAADL